MNDDLLDKFNEVEKFHWWWAGRQELVKDLLKPEKPQKILDIGCGTGETLTFMKKVFPKSKLQGVDYLPEAVKYTKGRGHLALRADALHLPFADATFDAVLLLDVIEHIKDDSGVIKEAKRILKPGGVIVLTAPALQFIWSAHDVGQGHERRYTRHMLLKLTAKNKMQVPFISYFNFLLSPVIILVRLASRLPLFSRLGQYDSKLNYQLAYKKPINTLLKSIFISEIKMLKLIRYPIGISIAVKMQKP
ncbi:MAG: class I SAM-dependent methyltransferase [Microgenomates group bacterium]